MFRIAIGAGHYLGTAGRRVPAALDPASIALADLVGLYMEVII